MITAENSTSIARQADDVFDFVSDLRNDPQWHTDVLDVQLTEEGSIHHGTIFTVRFKPFMGQSEGRVTVSEYDPPRRVVLRGQMDKMAPTLILSVEPQGEGSRFTRRVELEPPGIMRLMAPFMGGMFRRKNAGFVANLKRVLEAR